MQSKVTTLGDKKITVRELTVREIKELFDMPEDCYVIDRLSFLLDKTCSGTVKCEDLLNFAPSELDPLVKDMIEVNDSFFVQADQTGMVEAGNALKKMCSSVSMTALFSLSNSDTV